MIAPILADSQAKTQRKSARRPMAPPKSMIGKKLSARRIFYSQRDAARELSDAAPRTRRRRFSATNPASKGRNVAGSGTAILAAAAAADAPGIRIGGPCAARLKSIVE